MLLWTQRKCRINMYYLNQSISQSMNLPPCLYVIAIPHYINCHRADDGREWDPGLSPGIPSLCTTNHSAACSPLWSVREQKGVSACIVPGQTLSSHQLGGGIVSLDRVHPYVGIMGKDLGGGWLSFFKPKVTTLVKAKENDDTFGDWAAGFT